VSGITAFPLQWELSVLQEWTFLPDGIYNWILIVNQGLQYNAELYPFMQYGTDWLAFAHIVIALPFIKLYKDPVQHAWLVDWGIIACIGILVLVPIAGAVRGIPYMWQLIDASFGLFGGLLLWIIRREIMNLSKIEAQ